MLVTFGGFAVVLSAAQHELRSLARQVDATNRLLSGSVIDARIGLVVAERGAEATRITWSNRAARRLLAAELEGDAWSGPLRTAAGAALRSGEQITLNTDEGRTITVAANPIGGADHRIAVQLLDVTAILLARRAQVEAEFELDAARTIRAELERQRDDFLVTTSHELRTPITSIVGYAELLADGSALGASERGWVGVIARNAQRLSELVEDLLTLGRGSDVPEAQLRQERVRCDELFDEVAGNLRPVSERKGLVIELQPGAHVLFVARHDASRMLSNLLTNACKFTPAGGRIRLSAHAAGDAVLILVADTGPGMSQDEIGHAFERFYRTPSAERENVEGTGLGLAIVAELARRNDGEVLLRRAEHGGLEAELRLPAARAPQPLAP
nr:HAMP domain-containing sensor histidine kinase [Agrococcus sp. ARC_14]